MMEVVYQVALPDGVEHYESDVLLTVPDEFRILNPPDGFNLTDRCGRESDSTARGKLELKAGETKEISFYARHRLLDPQPNPHYVGFLVEPYSGFESSSAVADVLRNLEITDDNGKPTSPFSYDIMKKLLDHLRKNFKYGMPKFNKYSEEGLKEFLKTKNGDCVSFATTFAQMVRLAGGKSRLAGHEIACQRLVRGKPYASRTENKFDNHAYTLVAFNDKSEWMIVDPTIYASSPEGIQDRAINAPEYVFFVGGDVELVDVLSDNSTQDYMIKHLKLKNKDTTPYEEKNIKNYHGKECRVSVRFPEED